MPKWQELLELFISFTALIIALYMTDLDDLLR